MSEPRTYIALRPWRNNRADEGDVRAGQRLVLSRDRAAELLAVGLVMEAPSDGPAETKENDGDPAPRPRRKRAH